MRIESFLELLKLVLIGLAAYGVFWSYAYIKELRAANKMLGQAISGQCEQVLTNQGYGVTAPEAQDGDNP